MFDSDTMLLTDHPLLIKAAERNYDKFLVPTNFVESKKIKRSYTNEQKADLDIKTSVNKIGEIINLSQEIQSLMWHKLNNGASFEEVEELYMDVCQLSVMSGVEIDSAKKEFAFSNVNELRKLRRKHIQKDLDGRTIKPYFFGFVARAKGLYDAKRMNYKRYDTSMDYLEELLNSYRSPTLPKQARKLSDIFNMDGFDIKLVKYSQIHTILERINEYITEVNKIYSDDNLEKSAKFLAYQMQQASIYSDISKIRMSKHTLLRLLQELDSEENKKIRNFLTTITFSLGHEDAFALVKESADTIPYLQEDPAGSIQLYGINFSKTCKFSDNSSNCIYDDNENTEENLEIYDIDSFPTTGE